MYVLVWLLIAGATWLVLTYPVIGIPTVLVVLWKLYYRKDR